jgi:hypothetical protein
LSTLGTRNEFIRGRGAVDRARFPNTRFNNRRGQVQKALFSAAANKPEFYRVTSRSRMKPRGDHQPVIAQEESRCGCGLEIHEVGDCLGLQIAENAVMKE